MVVPEANVIVPVGLPLVAIVAVSFTVCPKCAGFALDVTVVTVAAFFTTWFSATEVLVLASESPL